MTYKVADIGARMLAQDAKIDQIVLALGQVCVALDRLASGGTIVGAPALAQVAAPTILALPAVRPADVTMLASGRYVCPRHAAHTQGSGEHVKLGFGTNGIASHVAWCKPVA